MADTTSWAQAQLPSNRNLGVESMLRSAAIGQAVGQGKLEAQKQAKISNLRNTILDAYKSQDRPGMMYAISELAQVDPEAAKASRDVYTTLDRTNGFQAAMLTFTAAASDTEEAQNVAIDQALEAMQVGPEHPFYQELLEIRGMPFGKHKDDALLGAVQVGQKFGFFPTKEEVYGVSGTATGKDDTLDWLKFGLDVKKSNQQALNQEALRKAQIEKAEEEKYQQNWAEWNLGTKQTEYYKEYSDNYRKSLGEFNKYANLADRFDELQLKAEKAGEKFPKPGENFKELMGWTGKGGTGGWTQVVGETVKRFMGWQDEEVTALYRDYHQIRNEFAMLNLPPGIASDADIRFALEGTPDKNANAGHVAQWLRGLSKMRAINAAHNRSNMEFMQNNRTIVGQDEYWELNKNKYLSRILNVPEEALTYDASGDPEWRIENFKIQTKPPEIGPVVPGKSNFTPRTRIPSGQAIPGRIGAGPNLNIEKPSTLKESPFAPKSMDKRPMNIRIAEAEAIAEQMDPDGSLGIKDRLVVRQINGVEVIGYIDPKTNEFQSIEVPPIGR